MQLLASIEQYEVKIAAEAGKHAVLRHELAAAKTELDSGSLSMDMRERSSTTDGIPLNRVFSGEAAQRVRHRPSRS